MSEFITLGSVNKLQICDYVSISSTPGVLQQLFDTLHDNGIISEDTFTLWEEIE